MGDVITLPARTGELTILVLGCGLKQAPTDYLTAEHAAQPMTWLTLDANAGVKPSLVCRLGRDPIPLADNSVDIVIANHLIEHVGQQGDTTEWFFFWEEVYRVLKPSGALRFECPYYTSLWAWADPTHVRAISEMTFLYFNQDAYRAEGSAIPRFQIRADFAFAQHPTTGGPFWETFPDHGNPGVMAKEPVSHIRGVLVARKPFRPWWED